MQRFLMPFLSLASTLSAADDLAVQSFGPGRIESTSVIKPFNGTEEAIPHLLVLKDGFETPSSLLLDPNAATEISVTDTRAITKETLFDYHPDSISRTIRCDSLRNLNVILDLGVFEQVTLLADFPLTVQIRTRCNMKVKRGTMLRASDDIKVLCRGTWYTQAFAFPSEDDEIDTRYTRPLVVGTPVTGRFIRALEVANSPFYQVLTTPHAPKSITIRFAQAW